MAAGCAGADALKLAADELITARRKHILRLAIGMARLVLLRIADAAFIPVAGSILAPVGSPLVLTGGGNSLIFPEVADGTLTLGVVQDGSVVIVQSPYVCAVIFFLPQTHSQWWPVASSCV